MPYSSRRCGAGDSPRKTIRGYELRFRVIGIIKDVDRLKGLFDVFAHTLRRMCEIGEAEDRAADVTW